jgi:ABC-2 type transport system ATP-binding protein
VTAPALRFAQVHKGFGGRGRRVEALAGLDLDLPAGSMTALVGPDGAGKTTLMRLAAGLLLPDAGQVDVLGQDTRAHAQRIQASVGYMPQRFGLYEDLSVQENLDLHADLQDVRGAARAVRYAELLRLTALGPFADRRAGALSGGMKQKLGLACALLRAPPLLLLDEPTVGVDPISRRELWAILLALRQGPQPVSVLLSTAYLDEAERCGHILILEQGRLLRQGPPALFRAAMQGRTFAVTHATRSRRVLHQDLVRRAGVIDAQVQAVGVRVVLAAAQAPDAAPGEIWQPLPPRFEDAFVALLQQQRGAPMALAAADAAPASHAAAAATVTDPAGDAGPEVVRVEQVHRFFGRFEAVKGVSFSVHRGEIFGLLGANGAGKTTIFRMLCGLLPPSAGRVEVNGVDLGRAAAAARQGIGYVSQKFALYGHLSVAQNLGFFAAVYGLSGARRRERLEWAGREFELAPWQARNAGELPLGFKQRLALACALLHEPTILFLDEPTSGVDPLVRREFWDRIQAFAARGVTVLVTTHFMDEAEFCDRVALGSQGEVVALGTPAAIRARARSAALPDPSMDDAFIALIEAHEAPARRTA